MSVAVELRVVVTSSPVSQDNSLNPHVGRCRPYGCLNEVDPQRALSH
jgi:hypothetical protein